jgi:undecaprenyl-diphosphatase
MRRGTICCMHQAVIVIAKYFIILSVIVTLWVFIEQPKDKKKEFILLGLIGGLLAILLAKLGGHFFYDTRPFVAGHFTPYFSHGADNGFPSDHTLLASFFMFLGWRYSRKFGISLFVLAILIGLSRVQAGVHHLVDIIGSFAFSALGFGLALLITRIYFNKTSGHKTTNTRR